MKKPAQGFTLIEILVVMTIMAILGVFALSNFTNYGEDQKLKNAVLDVQSLLRQAQTNATANIRCLNTHDAVWKVEFTGDTNFKLKCKEPNGVEFDKKTLTLGTGQTMYIQKYSISGKDNTGNLCNLVSPPVVDFAPVSGKIGFGGTDCVLVAVNLKNTKTQSMKSLVIEQGGRIYAP